MVQTVLSHLSGVVGFDEDADHYMNVAVRESVVNAIEHGNRRDERQRVTVDFPGAARALEVEVQDEGGASTRRGPDPVAEENLLKPTAVASSSCGRSWTTWRTPSRRRAAPWCGW